MSFIKGRLISIGLKTRNKLMAQLENNIAPEKLVSKENIREISKEIYSEVFSSKFHSESECTKEIEEYIQINLRKYLDSISESLTKKEKIRNNIGGKFKCGLIYLIRRKKDDLVKIGLTTNFLRRLKELELSNMSTLEVLFLSYTDDVYKKVSVYHRHFNSKKITDDWFELDEEDISYIINNELGKIGNFK
ncbi:GIY-YIG nuclease family protein [Bacillus sp. AGMB 02131]|uniref:GIY-YIG nuclease family protein n=1 Tax=Peribacillus faecalis TaxID=2772559 RepID=A0A927CYR9_9BACI|nr:GIY-YIG nuclease family protein [Peribacillus faecalis]MBD3110158.1 GIY-YIG nuclease family protein [Peribacillus faecalis]